MSLLALGYFEQARARIAEALIEARRLAHPITSAVVLGRACIIHRYVNGCRTFEEAAEALCSIAAEQGFVNRHGHADVELGWATVAAGQIDAGLARMRKGLAAVHTVEQQFDLPRYLGLFADAHRLAGQAADGLKILEDALHRANGTGERWFEAELHRLKGEVIQVASPDAHGQAAACFRQAVEVAQRQGARLWELRASVSLTRLWREHGNTAEARDLLSPTYARFTEGFDTPDLTAARALLDEFMGLP